jgi:hypothetical protein
MLPMLLDSDNEGMPSLMSPDFSDYEYQGRLTSRPSPHLPLVPRPPRAGGFNLTASGHLTQEARAAAIVHRVPHARGISVRTAATDMLDTLASGFDVRAAAMEISLMSGLDVLDGWGGGEASQHTHAHLAAALAIGPRLAAMDLG